MDSDLDKFKFCISLGSPQWVLLLILLLIIIDRRGKGDAIKKFIRSTFLPGDRNFVPAYKQLITKAVEKVGELSKKHFSEIIKQDRGAQSTLYESKTDRIERRANNNRTSQEKNRKFQGCFNVAIQNLTSCTLERFRCCSKTGESWAKLCLSEIWKVVPKSL